MGNVYFENTLVWVITGLFLAPLIILSAFLDFFGGMALLAGLCIGVAMVVSLSALEKLSEISKLRLTLPLDIIMEAAKNNESFAITKGNHKLVWNPKKQLRG